MRVLVASTAGSGHFGPLVPVARACVDAGHRVAVAAPGSFAPEVARSGLLHLPFDDVPPEQLGPVMGRLPTLSTEEANRLVVTEVFGRLDARAALPGVTEVVETWRPDLVLREPVELGSLAAALAAGIPQAVVAVNVSSLMGRVAAYLTEPLGELDGLVGLPPGTCCAALRGATTFSSVPARLDDACGARLTSGPLHRYRETPPAPMGLLPERWGDPDQPLVYVSFGSVAAGIPTFAGIYAAVLEALADEPVRVLMTTGNGLDPADLRVPANACVQRWWPQAEVLPHAAAVIGHGGFGTTMMTLAAGVPQVVLPLFASDQFLNAEHVAACGAGLAVAGGVGAADALPAALAAVLHEERYAAGARAVAAEMAALPPVAEVVPLLEELAGRVSAG